MSLLTDSSLLADSASAPRRRPSLADFAALCAETFGLLARGVTRPVLLVWALLLVLLTLIAALH